jgi:hypothetical protein
VPLPIRRPAVIVAATLALAIATASAQTAAAPAHPGHAAAPAPAQPQPPMRSWADYWKAVRAHQIASEPDPRVMIKRLTQQPQFHSQFQPEGGPVGNQSFTPYFSGADTTVSFYSTVLWGGLYRQPDCSLDEVLVGNPRQYDALQSIPHYEQYLHTISGLTTTVDKYPNGCDDPGTPPTMQQLAYAGKSASGDFIAAHFDFANPSNLYIPLASTSKLVSEQTYSPAYNIYGVLAADFNGDGKMDLAVSDTSDSAGTIPQISILLGNGDGTFQSPTQITGYNFLGVVAGDFNGDGKVDLEATILKGTGDYQLLFFAGKGNGSFASPVVTDTGSTEKLVTLPAKLTSGGPLDIVAWDVTFSGFNSTATLDLLQNNGSATFTSKPSTFTSSQYNTVSVGDLNNDGKLDLVVNSYSDNAIDVLKGNGDGTFTLQYIYPTVFSPNASVITDLDGDGNADIFIGLSGAGGFGPLVGEGGAGQALLGHGDFTFSTPAQLQPLNSTTTFGESASSLVVADLNGDSKQDLAVLGQNASSPNSAVVNTFLGNGTSALANGSSITFSLSNAAYTPDSLLAVPLNGTSPIDLVVAGLNPANSEGAVQAAINNGSGSFTVNSTLLDLPAPVESIVAADFNGDGKADLAFILNDNNQDAADALYLALGNGDGTFKTPTILNSAIEYGGLVVTADVNNDGKPDLIVIPVTSTNYYSSSALVYLNKGGGSFSSPTSLTSPDGANLYYAVAGNFTGSGHMDLALIGTTDEFDFNTYLFAGNGSGGFTYSSTSSLGPNFVSQAIAVDVNQDGVLDLVANGCCGLATPLVALGKGGGAFYPAQPFNSPTSAAGVQAINLNGDKYPDLVFILSSGASAGGVVPVVNHYANAPNVTKAATTVTVPNPGTYAQGQTVYIYLTVTENSAAGQPAGTVSLLSGSTVLQTATLEGGSAYFSLPTTGYQPGTFNLTVDYSGDNFNLPSSATVPVVIQYLTETTLTVTPPAINYDGTVTLTSHVTRPLGTGNPTGYVEFFYNGGNSVLANVPIVNGVATLNASVKGYPAGQYVLQAGYYGEGTNGIDADSSSPLVNTSIAPEGLTATTTSLALSPNPITYGQKADLIATVAKGTGSGAPTGTVTFFAEFYGTTYNLGTVPLSNGVASASASTAGFGYTGFFILHAIYNGNSSTYTSTSSDLSIYLRPTSYVYFPQATYTVTSGQSLTLTAEVPQESYYPVNGTLTFSANGAKLATVQVTNNQATFTGSTNGLPKGNYTVTATYNGDQYNGTGSGTATVTIQ